MVPISGQEIEILRGLRHENIVLMLDYFETEDGLCVVTEFAQGERFEVLEDDKSLPEAEIRQIARQLVHALHYLHCNRISTIGGHRFGTDENGALLLLRIINGDRPPLNLFGATAGAASASDCSCECERL